MNLVIRFFIGMPMKAIATAGHACIQSSGIGQDPHRFSKKIGQNRFHDPAPQTRRFLSGYNYRDCGPFVKSSI
ncbi:hypothetical protein [Adlercreutzia equolifaciens]|uniref:hypothetical protein n=1 Tax=Adlercreutzia equolifaciens TaxID=446660 RepID=UPI003AAAD03A